MQRGGIFFPAPRAQIVDGKTCPRGPLGAGEDHLDWKTWTRRIRRGKEHTGLLALVGVNQVEISIPIDISGSQGLAVEDPPVETQLDGPVNQAAAAAIQQYPVEAASHRQQEVEAPVTIKISPGGARRPALRLRQHIRQACRDIVKTSTPIILE